MTYHIWGDEWFEKNGNDLHEAENYISQYVYNTSYCRLTTKEKYGTLRYEYLYPNLPIKLINRLYGTIVYNIWINYGKKKVQEAVESAIERWPNLKDELLDDLNLEYL